MQYNAISIAAFFGIILLVSSDVPRLILPFWLHDVCPQWFNFVPINNFTLWPPTMGRPKKSPGYQVLLLQLLLVCDRVGHLHLSFALCSRHARGCSLSSGAIHVTSGQFATTFEKLHAKTHSLPANFTAFFFHRHPDVSSDAPMLLRPSARLDFCKLTAKKKG